MLMVMHVLVQSDVQKWPYLQTYAYRMFGVILKVIHLGTGLCSYPNYREEKIPIFFPKKKQDIFHSSTVGTAVALSSALISSFPFPCLAQAGRVAAGKVYSAALPGKGAGLALQWLPACLV